MTTAKIENGYLVIRVAIASLPQIVEGAWAAGFLTPRYRVTDADKFARDLLLALNDESEDGSTRVHQMFDSAIKHAIDYGADGIDEHEVQDA